MDSAAGHNRPARICLLIVFAVLWFSNIEYRKLVKPDEGRYAEISREMAETGDWLTPRLNGIKYFEKPPLQYWATAAAYKLFGEHEWTARLWNTVTGFLGVLLTGFAGRRLFGEAAGFYAAAVLGSSLYYVLLGHINTLDMGVSFFMALALVGFVLTQENNAAPLRQRRWILVAWAAMGLAMLSKGLIGIVLPVVALVLYSFCTWDWSPWKRLHIPTGLALFLVIVAPWFVTVSIANPEFPYFFFVHEHFQRFATTIHRRYAPFWYFIPILVLGVLPWVGLLWDGLRNAWKREAGEGFQVKRFLLIWIAFIFLFFSASNSKLPGYILPVFPAVALLIGQRLTEQPIPRLLPKILSIGGLYAAGFCAAGTAFYFPETARTLGVGVPIQPEMHALYQEYAYWLLGAAAVMFFAIAYFRNRWQAGRHEAAVMGMALASLGAAQLALSGHNSLAPSYSAYHIAQQIEPYLAPGVPFYSLQTYDQTLDFYIKRTVRLVDFKDELDYGLQQEPRLALPTLDDFKREWGQNPKALALMQPELFEQLREANLPMRVIARDTRRVIVSPL